MRYGFTTGSCAAAAAKAATYMLLTGKEKSEICIKTPKGIDYEAKIVDTSRSEKSVRCSVIKDGGDDPDVTTGAHIIAEVAITSPDEYAADINGKNVKIVIDGGIGVGRVTKPGLDQPVGEAAINHVPREMIEKEVREVCEVCDYKGTLYVTISVPEGEKIAKQTFNPRLGIVGGISILGTSGIVEPMSDEGWKKSLSLELEMKREQGLDKIILVPGNHGEEFIQNELGLDMKYVVRMSNFVGYMLMEAKRLGYKKLLLAGHIGKFIKVAAGIFQTHSKVADARNEIMISNLALMGAPVELLKQIDECVTAEGAVEIIDQSEYTGVYEILCNKCRDRVKQHLGDDSIDVGVYMFRMDKSYLGKSDNADSIVEVFK